MFPLNYRRFKMSLNIYCCGGTGVNIGKRINDLDFSVYFIDSSRSNLKDLNSEYVFLVEDMDGAGKNRKITYEKFKEFAETILIKFKPSKALNIVISSLSGGTGSVISPLITKKLIENGHSTIVIGIDSTNSAIEIENSVKTLKSYKSISNATGKPIALYYVENNVREEADKEVLDFINVIGNILLNTQITEEFDLTDLHNFINYDNVTENDPDVGILTVSPNVEYVGEKNTHVVSSIFITNNPNSKISNPKPDYLATCIVTDPDYSEVDTRIDNTIGKLPIIIEHLEKELEVLKENRKTIKVKSLEVNSNTEDGLVL